jgi:two-component system, OmpR family, response regulator RegX3
LDLVTSSNFNFFRQNTKVDAALMPGMNLDGECSQIQKITLMLIKHCTAQTRMPWRPYLFCAVHCLNHQWAIPSKKMHIAILEDDAEQRELMEIWLKDSKHSTHGFGTRASCIEGLKQERFDLLLLDWMLPDGTGADVLHWVRQNLGWDMPIVVVTAFEDEANVITALRAGADDYVVKPPKPLELMARLLAVTRRVKPSELSVLRMGAYEADMQRHTLSMDNEPVAMTQKEFDLSVYLLQNPGKLLSRDHLLNKVWGLNADVDTRTIDTHISRLRKKLVLNGTKGWKLVPVYGYGYRFDRVDLAAPVV